MVPIGTSRCVSWPRAAQPPLPWRALALGLCAPGAPPAAACARASPAARTVRHAAFLRLPRLSRDLYDAPQHHEADGDSHRL